MKRDNVAARLRHRLTLQEEVETPDTAGGYTRSWQNVVDLWAEIVPVAGSSIGRGPGNEILFAGQMQSQISHRITLRYRPGITAGQRLLYEGRPFNIRYVINRGERDELLELLADEGVGT